MMLYSRRDVAVMAYCAGLLTGLIVAFASCAPATDETQHNHITTGAHQ